MRNIYIISMSAFCALGIAVASASCATGEEENSVAVAVAEECVTSQCRAADPAMVFRGIRDILVYDKLVPPIAAPAEGHFGSAIAPLGDWDGDGPIAQVIAVGDPTTSVDFDIVNRGDVYILFVDARGAILSARRIDADSPGAPAPLKNRWALFGWSLASLGDLDGPGESVAVLAIGVPRYFEEGRAIKRYGTGGGAVVLAYLLPDGTVSRWVTLNGATPNGPGYLTDYHEYGNAVASLGDWDGAGGSAHVLAVGAPFDSRPHPLYHDTLDPAIFLHALNADGSVLRTARIDNDTPGMPAEKPEFYSQFGASLAYIPEENGTGLLAANAVSGGQPGIAQRGEMYLFRLNRDFSIREVKVLNAESPGAAPIVGTPRQRTSVWYFGPALASLQPLLRPNNRGISYLLATLVYTNTGQSYRTIGLGANLDILSHNTLTNADLAPINYDRHGEIIYVDGIGYIGPLNPAEPDIHSIGIAGQLFSEGTNFRQAVLLHQVHIPEQ